MKLSSRLLHIPGWAAAAALFLSPALDAEGGGESRWVSPGADGHLHYKADEFGTTLPDFSAVGYRGGGVALPDTPVRAELNPAAPENDTPRIQATLDRVAALPADAKGSRGAVLLRRGTYRCAGELRVASGVVLRGEGQDSGGTILIATALTGDEQSHPEIADNSGLVI